MAILTDLVDVIAKVEDVDAATVGLIARYLREAGLIAMHGRGPSAAKMGLTDAVNLLIGVNATSSAVDAPRVVRAYRWLQALEFRATSDPRPQSSRGTLGKAMEELLSGACRGELPDPFIGQELDLDFQDAFSRGEVHVVLRFRKLFPAAYLAMTWLPGADAVDTNDPDLWIGTRSPEFRAVFLAPPPRGPPEKKKQAGDRSEQTSIGYRTLHAVGKLIG